VSLIFILIALKRMIMRLGSWTASLLLFSLLVSCSRKPQFATSAVPKDFEGHWSGTWSWNTNSTTVEISGTSVKVSGFPVKKGATDEIVVVSSEGEGEFLSEWSRRAPCVLVSLPNPKIGVPLYLTRDKEHLVYDASVSRGQRIIFKKIARSDKKESSKGKSGQ
jgi:hypothetical protein